ncbi:NAD(P)-dependent oxidoreductase [Staphylococcus aureus]|uniref:NAD(P)-dependent oxidoreductase n=1 Tax=Staphylococcus aureus TaxID=1280 RepID=UPI003F546E72
MLAFDPYLTDEKAKSLSITKATVDEIAQHSDFVTLHTPLTPKPILPAPMTPNVL